MKQVKLGDAVVVQCLDLTSLDSGWQSMKQNGKLEPEVIECVGYVVGISKTKLVLSLGWSGQDSILSFAIPIGCIKSCHSIKTGKRLSLK